MPGSQGRQADLVPSCGLAVPGKHSVHVPFAHSEAGPAQGDENSIPMGQLVHGDALVAFSHPQHEVGQATQDLDLHCEAGRKLASMLWPSTDVCSVQRSDEHPSMSCAPTKILEPLAKSVGEKLLSFPRNESAELSGAFPENDELFKMKTKAGPITCTAPPYAYAYQHNIRRQNEPSQKMVNEEMQGV